MQIKKIIHEEIAKIINNPKVKKFNPQIEEVIISPKTMEELSLEGRIKLENIPTIGKITINLSGTIINQGNTIQATNVETKTGNFTTNKMVKNTIKPHINSITNIIQSTIEQRENIEIISMHIEDGKLVIKSK